MEFSALGLFALALLVNAGSPGPSIAALVARVISGGLGSVLPFLAAMWIGEALWLIAAVLGLGFLAQQFHAAFVLLKYAGIAYLVWLAWKMWTKPAAFDEAQMPGRGSGFKMFLTGLALTIGNPKIMVFYLALLPSLINIDGITVLGLVELVAVAFAVMMTVDLAWAFAAAWARSWLKTPRAVRIANRCGSATMFGAAAVIATR